MARIILGKDVQTGRPVGLGDRDRQRGTYIIGTTGTGKTSLMRDLIRQGVRAGEGALVCDPHGDLIDQVTTDLPAERESDVVLLDPRDAGFPFGLNPFWCEDPDNVELVSRKAGEAYGVIEARWGARGTEGTSWGPVLAQYLRNLCYLLVENPGLSMTDIPGLLTRPERRGPAVACLRNHQVRRFWENYDRLPAREQREQSASVLNKFDEFLTHPILANIIGQSRTTADLRRFMDEGKIVLVPLGLGHLGAPVADLLGSLIILEALNAALSRENLAPSERRPFNVFCDEFQRFDTPALGTLLTESRKYGISMWLAHQVRGQLSEPTKEAVLNAGNVVVFAVHGGDGKELAPQFDRTPPPPEVVGQRQSLSFSQEPVQHLVRSGHRDQCIRDVTSRRLTAMAINASSLTDGRLWSSLPDPAWANLFFDEGAYYASRATLQNGMAAINAWLVDLMENRLRLEASAARLFEIVFQLRAYFRVATFEEPALAGPSRTAMQSDTLKHREVGWMSGMGEEELQAIIHAELAGDFHAEAEVARYAFKRVVFWEVHLEHLMGWKDPHLVRKLARKRALFEAVEARNVVMDLLLLGVRLIDDPILVDSGQWLPTLDRPRTYSDVEGEIASRLVNQPQFHAICRINRDGQPEEHELRTAGHVHTIPSAHSIGKLQRIQARSRLLYCRPRYEVEAERLRREHPDDDDGNRVSRVTGV